MIAETPLVDWPPDEAVDFEALINSYLVAFELIDRNADALKAWRWRQAMTQLEPAIQGVLIDGRIQAPPLYPDAYGEAWRSCLELWFETQRDLAKRWLFKNRCERRAQGLTGQPWSRQRRPMTLRKQAD